MNLNDIPLFGLISRRMSWLTQRNVVLAENIANADSPGYMPKDLTKDSFRRMLLGSPPPITLAATRPDHIAAPRSEEEFRAGKQKKVYEAAPSGNAVVLEEQLMKEAETQSAFRLATNLYRTNVAMIKEALGRGP